jgi:hypothetical protein
VTLVTLISFCNWTRSHWTCISRPKLTSKQEAKFFDGSEKMFAAVLPENFNFSDWVALFLALLTGNADVRIQKIESTK